MVRSLALAGALTAAFAVVGGASGGGAGWPQPDARDKALLASILQGMKADLRTVRLTQLDSMWRDEKRRGKLELVTTTSVGRKAHVRSIRADWDTLLIAHAYNERCIRKADHCVAVYSGPTGGGGAGRSAVHRPFWSAHRLAHAIRSRFTAAGLRVTSIEFEHPNALAPIITLRSPYLRRRALQAEKTAMLALLPAFRHTEGRFVAMFGPQGRLLLIESGSGNTGEGWCAPVIKCSAP